MKPRKLAQPTQVQSCFPACIDAFAPMNTLQERVRDIAHVGNSLFDIRVPCNDLLPTHPKP